MRNSVSTNIPYSHIYGDPSPNSNLPIYMQWRFWAQPSNLIPANISGYMVIVNFTQMCVCTMRFYAMISYTSV